MNLIEDLKEILEDELQKMGYSSIKKDTYSLLIALFNLQKKTISIKRRNVKISRELSQKNIKEPYNSYLKGITRDIKEGKDINPYLSKKSRKLFKDDLLLYDWGIHHLHLEKKLENKRYSERSNYILFFILKEENVYFIDVTEHALEDETEFSQQHLLTIAKINWPNLFTTIKGVTGEKINDKEFKEIRDISAMALPIVDGEVIAPMGGGYSTAKTSIIDTQKTAQILNELIKLEGILKIRQSNLKQITDDLKITSMKLNYKLVLKNKSLYIVEENSGTELIEAEGLFETIFGHLN